MKNRVDQEEHAALPWKVHMLVFDYEIEDIWRLPVILGPDDDIAAVWDQMQLAISHMGAMSLTTLLFRIRFFLGRLLGWDREAETSDQPLTLRKRLAAQEGVGTDGTGPAGRAVGFSMVYTLQDEFLAEIANKTAEAALHLGRTTNGNDRYGVNLTVYVKPKGLLGRAYMSFIKPFRLWIVYPAILKATAKQWTAHQAGQRDG